MNTLFNKRDYTAAERFWSPNYIQHGAHIEPRRDGLFNLIKAAPASLKHEPGVILAEGDYVIVHGRFSAIQDEATEQRSKSGTPMFSDSFRE
jgi:predicted SnoaL-like aldol condensation-catalyzing enzyme